MNTKSLGVVEPNEKPAKCKSPDVEVMRVSTNEMITQQLDESGESVDQINPDFFYPVLTTEFSTTWWPIATKHNSKTNAVCFFLFLNFIDNFPTVCVYVFSRLYVIASCHVTQQESLSICCNICSNRVFFVSGRFFLETSQLDNWVVWKCFLRITLSKWDRGRCVPVSELQP